MHWAFFVTLTALFWGATNIFDKILVGKYIKSPWLVTILVGWISFLFVAPLALVFGLKLPAPEIILLYSLSAVMWQVGIWLYYRAVGSGEASRVVTAFNTLPFFVLVFAALLLGETVSFQQFIGIALLVVGAVLVSLKKSKGTFIRKWIIFVVLAAALFGLDTIITKYVISLSDWFTALFLKMCFSVVLFTLLLPFYFPGLKAAILKKPKALWFAFIGEGMSVTARSFLYIALSLGPASLVYAITSIQPFFVLVFAIACTKLVPQLLKEEIDVEHVSIKLIAVILAVAGAAMVSL